MNFNLHDSLEAKAQRLLNTLEAGTILPIHRQIAETYMVIRGRIRVMFYNEWGGMTTDFLSDPLEGNYGVHIPKDQWHMLEVLESGTVIFEVKGGPYTPIEPEDLLY